MTPSIEHLRKKVLHLARVFRTAQTDEEMLNLLEDFLTPPELEDLCQRWDLVSGLMQGKTQRQVKDEAKVSISKVSRGAQTLRFGSGGFKLALDRLKKKK